MARRRGYETRTVLETGYARTKRIAPSSTQVAQFLSAAAWLESEGHPIWAQRARELATKVKGATHVPT